MTYHWRSLTVADARDWSLLTGVLAEADGTGEQFSAEDLAEELAFPSIDPARDTLAVYDGATLVAYGQVLAPVRRADGAIRAAFAGGVHPEHRGRGIGSALLERLERRAIGFAAERFPDVDPGEVRPSTGVGAQVRDACALLEARGYRPIRWFHEMRHDTPPVPPPSADGLIGYRPDLDDAVRAAHVDAFAEHWGFSPPDDARWRFHFTGSRTFRPEFSSLVPATSGATGEIDGYVLAYQFHPDEVRFCQVGVRHRARGRGLARALLLRSLAQAYAAGVTAVTLDVDGDNADGAGRLYESVGFAPVRTRVVYQQQGAS